MDGIDKEILNDLNTLGEKLKVFNKQAKVNIDALENEEQKEFLNAKLKLAFAGKLDVDKLLQELKDKKWA